MRATVENMRYQKRYCERELAKTDLPDGRRFVLEEKLEHALRFLADRCSVCGRPLENDESKARGIGSECWAAQRKAS